MSMTVVFTLTGTDRVGIVDEVTGSLLAIGGNIEASRMARLGGEFAVIMLVTLPVGQRDALDRAVAQLTRRGYRVTTTPTAATGAEHAGWLPYHVEVGGADHQGLVNRIAHTLSEYGITIESVETGSTHAPNSGILLFTMRALVLVPPHLKDETWRRALGEVAEAQHVDLTIGPASASEPGT